MAPPNLEDCFTMRMYLGRDTSLSIGPAKGRALRIVTALTHGSMRAGDLDAELLPNSADWILYDEAAGKAYLDIRSQFRTKDGHAFYVQCHGIATADEHNLKTFAWASDAQSTEFGDHEWFVAPTVETNHPDFKWMEGAVFVGEGRWVVPGDGSQAVEFAIYQLRPSKK